VFVRQLARVAREQESAALTVVSPPQLSGPGARARAETYFGPDRGGSGSTSIGFGHADAAGDRIDGGRGIYGIAVGSTEMLGKEKSVSKRRDIHGAVAGRQAAEKALGKVTPAEDSFHFVGSRCRTGLLRAVATRGAVGDAVGEHGRGRGSQVKKPTPALSSGAKRSGA
jgi:hypothetical protein